jgi:hypothetical protein
MMFVCNAVAPMVMQRIRFTMGFEFPNKESRERSDELPDFEMMERCVAGVSE